MDRYSKGMRQRVSLEDEFIRVTRQADFSPVARQILAVMEMV